MKKQTKQVIIEIGTDCQRMEESIRNKHIDIELLLTECISICYEQTVKDTHGEVCK